MSVIYLKDFIDLKDITPGSSLVLGNFDGVHIGHYQLISFARYSTKGRLAIVTFDSSLKNDDKHVLLSFDDKIKKFNELGVDDVYVFKCDENFKSMSCFDFIDKILITFKPNKIFCGPDFRFGYKAQGNVDVLKQSFNNVIVLNYVNDYDGTKISSSIIKEYISRGEIKNANRFLGYEYYIKGIVVKGKRNGKKIGFPTINLKLDTNYVIPKTGVYITKTKIGNKLYPSMTNVGTHPTIDELNAAIIETHILDFDETLYGEEVEIKFLDYIRNEIKFNSIDELKEELSRNREIVRQYFD